jgi:hypothetical protein
VLKDGEITLPSGGCSSSSALDYSAQIVVLQQLVNNIPVPNSYTTISLIEFIYRVLQAYTVMTNWQRHLEHFPILPLLDYKTFTLPEVIAAARFFLLLQPLLSNKWIIILIV